MDNFFGCRSTSKSNLTQSLCWFAFRFAAAQHIKFCSLATRLRQNLFTSVFGARLEVGLGTFSTLQNEQFLCIFDFNLSILVLSSSFFSSLHWKIYCCTDDRWQFGWNFVRGLSTVGENGWFFVKILCFAIFLKITHLNKGIQHPLIRCFKGLIRC